MMCLLGSTLAVLLLAPASVADQAALPDPALVAARLDLRQEQLQRIQFEYGSIVLLAAMGAGIEAGAGQPPVLLGPVQIGWCWTDGEVVQEQEVLAGPGPRTLRWVYDDGIERQTFAITLLGDRLDYKVQKEEPRPGLAGLVWLPGLRFAHGNTATGLRDGEAQVTGWRPIDGRRCVTIVQGEETVHLSPELGYAPTRKDHVSDNYPIANTDTPRPPVDVAPFRYRSVAVWSDHREVSAGVFVPHRYVTWQFKQPIDRDGTALGPEALAAVHLRAIHRCIVNQPPITEGWQTPMLVGGELVDMITRIGTPFGFSIRETNPPQGELPFGFTWDIVTAEPPRPWPEETDD